MNRVAVAKKILVLAKDLLAEDELYTLNPSVIRNHAQKQGFAGSHWMKVVRQTLKSGDGKVKVIERKGDMVSVVADHPMGRIMGGVDVPESALVPA